MEAKLETSKITIKMKDIDELKSDFFDWSKTEFKATTLEEAVEEIERIRGQMEEKIDILADGLIKKAKAVFPEDDTHYQIKIDED